MNSRSSRRPATGLTSTDTAARYMPETSIDVFAKARDHERIEQLRAAREADILPYFRTVEGPALPRRRDGGRRADHARLQQLPRAHERRARHRRRAARRAGHLRHRASPGSRLLNGTTPLHLELEREIAEWMGTEDAIVFTTGHQANVGTLGTILGPGRHRRSPTRGDHASILDGCLLSRAKLRPFRHNAPRQAREGTLERAAGRRRRRPRRRRRRVLDGGRRRRRCPRSPTCASASARG